MAFWGVRGVRKRGRAEGWGRLIVDLRGCGIGSAVADAAEPVGRDGVADVVEDLIGAEGREVVGAFGERNVLAAERWPGLGFRGFVRGGSYEEAGGMIQV